MVPDELDNLFARIEAMTNADRERLDPIATALDEYVRRSHDHFGIICVPNRVVALACVDLLLAWDGAEIARGGKRA